MQLDEAREFIRTHHRAVVVARRRDGGPLLSPVTVGLQGEHVVISSRQTAYKVKALRRDPRASLCVLSDSFFGAPWIQVDGTAEIVPLPEAMELLVDYYRDISGEHPDWDDYRRAMERDRRVIIRITLERAGPDRHG
ncbi:MAG: PPOX class F420-dependent oxidoreductase [Actinomycetota bacterium]|nr:PPOX class F420-dependent oxidoreductase [Actinomycetota bacterium]